MKKMIFSAIALTAFSFAGMANEIEEKKVETQIIITDCFIDACEYLDRVDPDANLSNREAQRVLDAYIAACEKGRTKFVSAN